MFQRAQYCLLSTPGFFSVLIKTSEQSAESCVLNFFCVLEAILSCSKTILSMLNHCLLPYCFKKYTRWLKKRKVVSEQWNNSHYFCFQNLICFWLSTPKLRFWYIDISFWFPISRDLESWIKTSDLNIFKQGEKQGISFRQIYRDMSTRNCYLLEHLAVFVSFFVQKQDNP